MIPLQASPEIFCGWGFANEAAPYRIKRTDALLLVNASYKARCNVYYGRIGYIVPGSERWEPRRVEFGSHVVQMFAADLTRVYV